jgi:hypothetical protein
LRFTIKLTKKKVVQRTTLHKFAGIASKSQETASSIGIMLMTAANIVSEVVVDATSVVLEGGFRNGDAIDLYAR